MPNSQFILILDDDSTIREFLVEALSEEGYRVRVVATVDEARAAIRTEEPDLLLCDHWLAGTTGLARELRAAGRMMPIVLVTADTTAKAQALIDVDFCVSQG